MVHTKSVATRDPAASVVVKHVGYGAREVCRGGVGHTVLLLVQVQCAAVVRVVAVFAAGLNELLISFDQVTLLAGAKLFGGCGNNVAGVDLLVVVG